jgi:hypothetical protein
MSYLERFPIRLSRTDRSTGVIRTDEELRFNAYALDGAKIVSAEPQMQLLKPQN